MAAIITDQLRILNAKNFVAGVQSSTNSYYHLLDSQMQLITKLTGIPIHLHQETISNESNDYWDTMLAMKKIGTSMLVK